MVWIQIAQSVPSHRKTRRLARSLAISIPQSVGHLVIFWLWALDNTADGNLDALTAEDIADGAGWEGDTQQFVEAMVHAGFFDREGDSVQLHDWHEYGGRLVEERRRNALRMQQRRAVDKPFSTQADHVHETDTAHSAHVQDTYGARAVVDKTRRNESRQDEIREENTARRDAAQRSEAELNTLSLANASVRESVRVRASRRTIGYSDLFRSFWAAYPRKDGKTAAFCEWEKLAPDDALLRQMLAAIERQRHDWDATDDPSRYTPYAKTWLRERRWEDDAEDDVAPTTASAWDDDTLEDVPF